MIQNCFSWRLKIEDLISAVEHLRKEVKVKEDEDVNLLLYSVFHYYYAQGAKAVDTKLFSKSRKTGFKFVDLELIFSGGLDGNSVRQYFQKDGWVLKQQGTLNKDEANIFFKMREIDICKLFVDSSTYRNCFSIYVETWIRNPDISF